MVGTRIVTLVIVNIVNVDNDSSSNTRNGNPEDVLDKLFNSEVSSDKGLSNKSLKGVTFSPEMIKKFEIHFEN